MNGKNFTFFSYFLYYMWTNWSPYNPVQLCKRGTTVLESMIVEIGFQLATISLDFCVCIMHNGAHHRISISSFCTHAEESFCIEQAREALFFPFAEAEASAPLPYFESTSTSTTAARRRRRWRHVRQSENVWPANTWADSPTRNTRERDSHNSICETGGEMWDAEGPLISSRCHFVKPSSDTLPFLRWRCIGTSITCCTIKVILNTRVARTFQSVRLIWKYARHPSSTYYNNNKYLINCSLMITDIISFHL